MRRYDFKVEKLVIKRLSKIKPKIETKIKDIHVYAKSLEDAKTIVIGLGYKIHEQDHSE